MNNERLFRILVLADIVLATLTILTEITLTLPQPLQKYVFSTYFEWGVAGPALFIFWIAIVAATVVSWVGLLLYWWPARALYVGAWVAMLILILASGPSVLTAPGAVLDTLEHLVSGILIGMMYFSDVKLRFEEDDIVERRALSPPKTPKMPAS